LGVNLVLPYWHVVADHDLDHVSGLYRYRNLRQFKSDIEFFLRHYRPVTLQEVIAHLDGSARLPARCFLPTFDDGFREIYEVVAPILRMQGVPAVFFLISSAVDNLTLCYPQKKSLVLRALDSSTHPAAERRVGQILSRAGMQGYDVRSMIRGVHFNQRYVLDELAPVVECDFQSYLESTKPFLTSAQIRTLLDQGFEVGAHSVNHPLYQQLPPDEQTRETMDSIKWISKHFGRQCTSFAVPFRDAGISPAFFERCFCSENIKVIFGSGGILPKPLPRHLARFTMERTNLPAEQILARQFGKALIHR